MHKLSRQKQQHAKRKKKKRKEWKCVPNKVNNFAHSMTTEPRRRNVYDFFLLFFTLPWTLLRTLTWEITFQFRFVVYCHYCFVVLPVRIFYKGKRRRRKMTWNVWVPHESMSICRDSERERKRVKWANNICKKRHQPRERNQFRDDTNNNTKQQATKQKKNRGRGLLTSFGLYLCVSSLSATCLLLFAQRILALQRNEWMNERIRNVK